MIIAKKFHFTHTKIKTLATRLERLACVKLKPAIDHKLYMNQWCDRAHEMSKTVIDPNSRNKTSQMMRCYSSQTVALNIVFIFKKDPEKLDIKAK